MGIKKDKVFVIGHKNPDTDSIVPMKEFVPYKHEKEVISIRIDSEVLKKVDSSAEHAGISRNEFINVNTSNDQYAEDCYGFCKYAGIRDYDLHRYYHTG